MKVICADETKLKDYTVDELEFGEFFEYDRNLYQKIGYSGDVASRVIHYTESSHYKFTEFRNDALVKKVAITGIEYKRV